MTKITFIYWLIGIFLVTLIVGFTHNDQRKKSNMSKLTLVRDGIYLLEGNGGNIGVLSGEEGVLLIDDQFSHSYSSILESLKSINSKPVSYVINTHWHVDHTNGNENFGNAGSTIIAQENSRQRMTKPQFIKVFNHHQKAYSEKGLPKISFSDKMNLTFNQQQIELIHVENAHTDGDLLVHIKEANVIHTGDVFVTYGYPFIDEPNGGSIQGVIKAIDYILSISDENTLFIPGHGSISKKSDLVNYQKMLKDIFSKVEKEVKSGKTIHEIIATHPTKGYSSEKINEAIFVEIIVNNLHD